MLLDLTKLLAEKVKSERSYSLSGSIIKTMFYALTAVYPSNRQALNADEWTHAGMEDSLSPPTASSELIGIASKRQELPSSMGKIL